MARIDTPAVTLLDHDGQRSGRPVRRRLRERYLQGRRTEPGSRRLYLRGASTRSSGARSTSPSQNGAVLSGRAVHWRSAAAWSGPARPDCRRGGGGLVPRHDALAASASWRDVAPATGLSFFDAQDRVRALNAYVIAESRRRIEAGCGAAGSLGGRVDRLSAAAVGGRVGIRRAGRVGRRRCNAEIAVYLVRDAGTGGVRAAELSEIAHFSDGTSRRTFGPVGGRLPNLAGLYDMVGNASEITQDLFRLVRPDMLHGARGGYVLRGGNALTPPGTLGVAHRAEAPFYTINGEVALGPAGLRLLLGPPILTAGAPEPDTYRSDLQNTEFDAALAVAHAELTQIRQTPGAAFREEARALLAAVGDGTADTERCAANWTVSRSHSSSRRPPSTRPAVPNSPPRCVRPPPAFSTSVSMV